MSVDPSSFISMPVARPLNVQLSKVTFGVMISLSVIFTNVSPPSILPKTMLVSESGRNLYRNRPVFLSETVMMPAPEMETSERGLLDGLFFITSKTGLPSRSRTTLKAGGLPGSRIKYLPLNAIGTEQLMKVLPPILVILSSLNVGHFAVDNAKCQRVPLLALRWSDIVIHFNWEQKGMRKEMDKIKERHAKEIADFVAACPHPKITGWIPYMWAPGHFSHNVKICERCGKTVEEESYTVPPRVGIV